MRLMLPARRGAPDGPRPSLLNLDASRLIYEGPVATGGGHGDIFKDDVVNLCWAVTIQNITPKVTSRLAGPPVPAVALKGLPIVPMALTLPA